MNFWWTLRYKKTLKPPGWKSQLPTKATSIAKLIIHHPLIKADVSRSREKVSKGYDVAPWDLRRLEIWNSSVSKLLGIFFEKIFIKFIDCKRWKLYSHLVFVIITFLKRVKAKLKKMIVFGYFKQYEMLTVTWSTPGVFWERAVLILSAEKKLKIILKNNHPCYG